MKNLIQCDALSKSYAAKQALHTVSFEISSGAPVALVGPNGAGKTTLLSLLCGFIQPSLGSIKVLGQNPGSPALCNRLGALPQDAQLDPGMSVHAQLSLLARLQGFQGLAAKREASRVLELVGLSAEQRSKPGALSHGMNKRVSIAQAFIGSPELILLDEPTAGLDPANTMVIRQCIAELADQSTFVISSHNLDELEKLCGSVLYLEKGVLSQEQLHNNDAQGYLGLTMRSFDEKQLLASLSALPGVQQVQQKHKNEFLIQYDVAVHAHLDQSLLQLMAEKKWQYRQLTQGQTLEDKLFS
jgi:ABC-2 type transport system ATP-binding protein